MHSDRAWAPRPWAKLSGICVAAIVVALASVAAAAGATPATLTGEFFFADRVAGNGTLNVIANCNPAGNSTISYSASGVASGPYPGTFTETGSATVGPLTAPQFVGGFEFGFLTQFDAFFTINSVAGQVTGTKSLELPSTALGLCYDTSPGTFRELSPDFSGFGLHYDATIEAGDGSQYGDTGRSGLVLDECESAGNVNGCGTTTAVFNEAFSSSLLTPFLISTPGQVTGGGRIGSSVAFGLTAKSDAQGRKGECTVIDRAANTTVKCLDVTSFVQTGNNVTFSGNAVVNGSSTTYRVDVSDNAEPGAGADTFAIHAGSYSAGGTLTQGNIQLHG
jgi:hypothetical protein